MHHAEALEAPSRALVCSADPLDCGVPPFLSHVLGARIAFAMPLSPEHIQNINKIGLKFAVGDTHGYTRKLRYI